MRRLALSVEVPATTFGAATAAVLAWSPGDAAGVGTTHMAVVVAVPRRLQ